MHSIPLHSSVSEDICTMKLTIVLLGRMDQVYGSNLYVTLLPSFLVTLYVDPPTFNYALPPVTKLDAYSCK